MDLHKALSVYRPLGCTRLKWICTKPFLCTGPWAAPGLSGSAQSPFCCPRFPCASAASPVHAVAFYSLSSCRLLFRPLPGPLMRCLVLSASRYSATNSISRAFTTASVTHSRLPPIILPVSTLFFLLFAIVCSGCSTLPAGVRQPVQLPALHLPFPVRLLSGFLVSHLPFKFHPLFLKFKLKFFNNALFCAHRLFNLFAAVIGPEPPSSFLVLWSGGEVDSVRRGPPHIDWGARELERLLQVPRPEIFPRALRAAPQSRCDTAGHSKLRGLGHGLIARA